MHLLRNSRDAVAVIRQMPNPIDAKGALAGRDLFIPRGPPVQLAHGKIRLGQHTTGTAQGVAVVAERRGQALVEEELE